ncbi:hypothetical protein [Sphingorhabdus sp.]|uniref:hypothetical protein n=1 Tax=Sphingorhabdus sp. TaxID=1902408 RepID=UPI002638A475|nr:hypothetical protein [Sphingorhabdus sp.]MDH4399244.1 hypothetical protein [Sphingorhabdus sp.]
MTMRSKIVGLSRDITETEQNASAPAAGEDEVTSDDGYDADLEEYAEERTYQSGILGYLAPVLLLVAFSTWTAFFALTYWPEIKIGLANERIIALVTTWSVPTLLITVLWLLAMRNSSREATRFGKVASRLRMESVALATRMRTVNGEISLAREFLSQNARELETVGRQSSQKLIESAQMLSAALADSDEKAKKLEAVSQAANTNLEHLRKHLPVVTSAAKDVTNQIGSAGNNAQVQIKSLIASLERVSDAGKSVNAYINNVETRADDLSVRLEQSLSGSAKLLDDKSAEALDRSAEMATLMDSAAQAISSGIAQASGDIDTVFAGSQAQIQSSLSDLRSALSEIEAQSQQEDARVRDIITAITAHIQTSAAHIAEVDKAATQQTSKLAFVVTALGESTRSVGSALSGNQVIAADLITQSDRLNTLLGAANDEIGQNIPAAMDNLNVRMTESISQVQSALSNAETLDSLSDGVLEKLAKIEQSIAAQHDAVGALTAESDVHFAARHEQVDALGAALKQTHALLEEMSGEANDRLVSSLLRVRETTRAAAESSRKILDEELAHIADQLTEQNRAALANALDAQVASMNEAVQEAIARNIELSEVASSLAARQLGELEEMTISLEGRIADTKNNFESVQADSFARRMVVLTESLNSTAIDVTKILSNEVTDTAWNAYLKGDRGVFARRAVRLLDSSEAKIIVRHYGEDSDFREHVNRYVHDFEAIMRLLLSTRDGNAIGVTLLSSDIGKLYVALAQAIERLRR